MPRESSTQNAIRLAAAEDGIWLLRNNSGALTDQNGRLVRFGLGNESQAVNAQLKSSDLVGIRPVLIQPHHVGMTIGQFIAIECKDSGWRGPAGDERAEAQQRWMQLVGQWGGVAGFATGPDMARGVWRS